MINTYDEFEDKLNSKVREGVDLYKEILETIIDNPSRYSGLFRLTNAKTKLLQNITQSREIKFGDFMEQIYTDYIGRCGYENLDKNLGTDINGDRLSVDQIFTKDNELYIIEQKIRDDHDSTKKRGQFSNFEKKIKHVVNKYPDKNIHAAMFFIDESLRKNKNYYLSSIESIRSIYENVDMKIFYGKSIFEEYINASEIWDETVQYLKEWKIKHTKDIFIPNLDQDDTVFESMKLLSSTYLSKLTNKKEIYVMLRKELFPNMINLKRLKNYFIEINDIRANFINL